MVFPQGDVGINDYSRTDQIMWDAGEKEDRSCLPADEDCCLTSIKSDVGVQNKSDPSDTIDKAGKLRRGTFKNPKDREQTAQTRLLTACIRCRMQRIRVRVPYKLEFSY